MRKRNLEVPSSVFLPMRHQISGFCKPFSLQLVVSVSHNMPKKKSLQWASLWYAQMTTTTWTLTIATGNDLPLATSSIYKSGDEHGLINLNWLWNGDCRGMTIVRNMAKWKNYLWNLFSSCRRQLRICRITEKGRKYICRFLSGHNFSTESWLNCKTAAFW